MENIYSVLNFEEPTGPREINSPRTLEACLRTGIDPSELYPKAKRQMAPKKSNLTEEMIETKYRVFEAKRKEKIGVVQAERDAIIAYNQRLLNATSNPDNAVTTVYVPDEKAKASAMLEMEQKRMEALRRRQEKEIQKIVEKEQAAAALQLKIKKAEDEELKKKKEHEKKVDAAKAAAQKKQIARLQELAQKEEEENEKRRELARKEAEFEKKRKKERKQFEKKLAEEIKAKEIEQELKKEEYRKKTEALLKAQMDLAEQNRLKMAEREERVREQLEQKKVQKANEIQEKRDIAAKRIAEAMVKFSIFSKEKKDKFMEQQKAALIRARELEKEEIESLKKQGDAREKKNKLRLTRLLDAYRTRKDHREDIVMRRSQKDTVFDNIQEERNKEIAMRKFMSDLKQSEKQSNIERTARVNEFLRLQTLQKITEEDVKHAKVKRAKQDLLQKQRAEQKESLIRKHNISDAMDLMRITNDFSMLDKLFASSKSKDKKGGRAKTAGDDGAGVGDGEDNKLNQTA